MMNKNAKIFITGHEGMIGAALVRSLKTAGFNNLVTKSSSQLVLTNQSEVRKFFLQEVPEYVFSLLSRKVVSWQILLIPLNLFI